MKKAFIYAAKRTPIGSFLGALSGVAAPQLGATAAKEALTQAKVEASKIDEVIVGCVLPAGMGQAPARQVGIFSGVPNSARAMTVNKVCGSGLKAVSLAADRIALGQSNVLLAGGIENMSQAPYYLKTARTGFRMGNAEAIDGMIFDGLWDPYNNYHMGSAGELCAREYKFSREHQDAFAAGSYKKAMAAISGGHFKDEIAVVEIKSKKETIVVSSDEEPGKGKIENFSKLRPAFDSEKGTITAANASSINDGAAMAVVAAEGALSSKPLARIIHCSEFAQAPEWFTTAPVGAIKKVLAEASLKVSDIEIFEINEAFSVVAMAAQKELEIPEAKLNLKGGAVALGHPIGASGCRLLTTMIYALKPGQKGIASLCIGGGEASAMLVERV
ncbi:MAG: thiolase family protein [Deltaproteobacteria bacterium]|nr:thiolase family protein [Deltaproteobacteria bacterium]